MKIAPYGSWKSPVTSDLIVSATIGLGQISIDGDDTYWIETRPAEKGRYVIVKRTADGLTSDVTPMPFNARTRVHEYGGGSFVVSHGLIYFSNFSDQRLYHIDANGQPQAISPEADLRYADALIDHSRNRIICIREDHRISGSEAINTLTSIDLDGKTEQVVLVSGHDFYSSPRLSPDGTRLAWLAWNHPNMPWDGTELWVADLLDDGSLANKSLVAGGAAESIFQPEWSVEGDLCFVSDRTGWWNLFRLREGKVLPLCTMEAEFGMPQWGFGMSTYAFESPDRIICAYIEQGISHLGILHTESGELEKIESSYSRIDGVRAGAGRAVFLGGSPIESVGIINFDLSTGKFQKLRRSSDVLIEPEYFSIPQTIEFPTENGLTAHAFFYPPRIREYRAPEGELPPLVVMSHGGPTAATVPVLRLGIQYWTSRGIAVLDVNYGGSTGYGREYRERLRGNWGIVDVEDCVNGARFLAARGLVDPNRMAITGGSAGGYTTLCALTMHDIFRAGASHYGVSDLEALEIDTHKFESRYSHSLVAPYPERADLYRERSPIHHADKLSAPVIFFQGLEDKVVPPNQAEMMVNALLAKGLPVAYLTFEGEQHGFRQAANIKRALDGELYFYSRVFGFEPADEIEAVPISNEEKIRISF